MNNENDLEREFLVYAAKAELEEREMQEITDLKIDLETAKLKYELATAYLELATLKGQMCDLKRELLAKDDEIDDLNKKLRSKNRDLTKIL